MLKLFVGLLVVILFLTVAMLIGIFLNLVILSFKNILIVLTAMILLCVLSAIINGIYKGK